MAESVTVDIVKVEHTCRCCLIRPPERDLKTLYTHLGKREIYADMITECFDIRLNLGDNECGICELCVGRLRDARDFKLQVQRSQAELERTLSVQDFKPIIKVEIVEEEVPADVPTEANRQTRGSVKEIPATAGSIESSSRRRAMSTTGSTASANKKRKVVHSEGREMIASIYHFLKEELVFTDLYKEPNCDLSHLRNVTKRTAEATGVSVRTVQQILKEERDLLKEKRDGDTTCHKFPSPMKKRRKRVNKVDIDVKTAEVVRSTINDFNIVQKQLPTLEKLKTVLNKEIGFNGCLATLRKLLRKLSYTWSKGENNKKVLGERPDIQMLRFKYLEKIAEYRSESRHIVFTGECLILTTHTVRDNKNKNKKTPSVKTTPFILVHAGTENGFVDNACFIQKALTRDHYMSYNHYVKWLDENLLPNLPDRSVIVINNSYQNVEEKLPTTESEMQEWLTSKGIKFDPKLRKIELSNLIISHKNLYVTYKVDNYIRSKGFEVLRLPPYHPELNAIESIWEGLQNNISLRCVEQNCEENLIHESISNITNETWRNICDSVMRKETEYMQYFDTIVDINVHNLDESDYDTVSEDDSSY